MENFRIIRGGYDGLEVSFKASVTPRLMKMLSEAKNRAVREKQDVLVQLSPRLAVHVAESGARGGYAYRLDTGPEGETWFIKHSDAEDWNFRVSCKSAMLARLGYHEAKMTLYDRLAEMGVFRAEESVGRFDMAFDFVAPDGFEIDPSLVVAASSTGVREHGAEMVTTEDAKISCIASRARRVETLTIGKLPGRQVTIYNKTAEINAKGKAYWWELWRLKPGTQVYRLEVRGGKKYLKERCGVTTFAELEERMPDIVRASLMKIRLCDPAKRHWANVTKRGFHPLWEAALAWVRERWCCLLKGCEPVRVLRAERKRYVEIFDGLVAGTLISFANVCEIPKEDFGRFMQSVFNRVNRMPKHSTHEFKRKWQKSKDKYRLLSGQVGGHTYGFASA